MCPSNYSHHNLCCPDTVKHPMNWKQWKLQTVLNRAHQNGSHMNNRNKNPNVICLSIGTQTLPYDFECQQSKLTLKTIK